ncbi:hypothetical protein B0H12DRAFT_970923, partial [Mycena haematopus]
EGRVSCPAEAAQWFHDAFAEVSRQALGPQYEEILRAFIKLEKSHGWALQGGHLKTNVPRPKQVSDWVKDGRGRRAKVKAPMPITDIAAFAKKWWAWWSDLQPAWRGAWRGRGTAEQAVPENADWGPLAVWGQNGLLSVVAAMYWWGCAEEKIGLSTRSVEWEEAAADLIWI